PRTARGRHTPCPRRLDASSHSARDDGRRWPRSETPMAHGARRGCPSRAQFSVAGLRHAEQDLVSTRPRCLSTGGTPPPCPGAVGASGAMPLTAIPCANRTALAPRPPQNRRSTPKPIVGPTPHADPVHEIVSGYVQFGRSTTHAIPKAP